MTAFATIQERCGPVLQSRLATASVTYTAAAGGAASASFDVIFHRSYVEPFGDVASAQPMIVCRASQLSDGGLRGGQFVVTGTPHGASNGAYQIAEPKPTGDGFLRLTLRKVA